MPDYHLDPYQEEAVEAFLKANTWGLFDEQGVGKTPPAIVAAMELPGPRLITAPAYLLPSWERKIRMFAPNATVSSTYRSEGWEQRTAALSAPADFVLTSYNTWSTFIDPKTKVNHRYPLLQKNKWGLYLFDESQRLRGRNNIWTQQLFKTRNVEAKNRTTPVWCLSGTPLVSNPGDIWPFLHHADRNRYRGYWNFVEEFCVIEDTNWDRVVHGLQRDKKVAFQNAMREFSMRRMLKDIPSLAGLEVVEEPEGGIEVPLPASVYEMFRKARKEYILEHPGMDSEILLSGGAMAQRFRMLTTNPPTQANPKVDAFIEWMPENAANERVVVFTWFRDSAQVVLERLRKRFPKRPIALFTGSSSLKQKEEALALYDKGPDTIVVATIAALKEGVDMQAGRRVVFIEETELPADMNQAISRLLRRGQTQTVIVTRFRATGSPDKIVERGWKARELNINVAMTVNEEILYGDHEDWGW